MSSLGWSLTRVASGNRALTIASEDSDPDAAARAEIEASAVQLEVGPAPVSIGSLPAVHAEGRDRRGDTQYRWGADWIAQRGFVSRVLFIAPEASWGRYGAPLTWIPASFRPLLPSDHDRIVDARLRIVETLPGSVEAAAAANALPENRVLPPHSLVKLALWEAPSPPPSG